VSFSPNLTSLSERKVLISTWRLESVFHAFFFVFLKFFDLKLIFFLQF
jgi:hypothetical protein